MLVHQAVSVPQILLVDDTPTNLKVLSDALRDQGWGIRMAVDGEEAIEQVNYALPDLVLLDVQMPGMDGFEVCRRLKANPQTQSVPVIFMTALADQTDKVQGLSLGAVDYITKPLQQDEVIARVRLHLQLSSLTKNLEQSNIRLNQKVAQQAATEVQLQKLAQELEQRVEDRTNELMASLEQIHYMQLHIIQQEKIASLGQLTAGIAHEINNPISFIYGNLAHVNEYTQSLLNIITLYERQCPQGNGEIAQAIEAADLDFIKTDLPRLLVSMSTGTERIKAIVKSLRNFSRFEESEIKQVDLHEGLDNTLAMVQSRLQPTEQPSEIHIIKDYGQLPLVECYAGQINQVFMHIINNAIDALHEAIQQKKPSGHHTSMVSEQPWSPQLILRTQCRSSDTVTIEISDNGLGIAEDIRHRLFDPFFTTKPVGKGAGLGLTISHYVITQQHGGQLACESGQLTTITITLPTYLSIPPAEDDSDHALDYLVQSLGALDTAKL